MQEFDFGDKLNPKSKLIRIPRQCQAISRATRPANNPDLSATRRARYPRMVATCKATTRGSEEKHIFVIGCTGDGKSATANQILRVLQPDVSNPPFSESASAFSHTHAVQEYSVTSKGVRFVIHDTPGLMDSKGAEEDEANIAKIVEAAREKGRISALVLVLNEKAKRFNSGMQAAVKLIFDSFGPECFGIMGIAYTHANGDITLDEAVEHSASVAELIQKRTGCKVAFLPCWQLENHPEALKKNTRMKRMPQDQLQEMIKELEDDTIESCEDLVAWARANEPLDTAAATVAMYEYREAQKKLEEAKAELEKGLAEEKTLTKAAETKAEEAAEKLKKKVDELERRFQNMAIQQQMMSQMSQMMGGGGGGGGGGCDGYSPSRGSSRRYAPSPAPSRGGAGNPWHYWRSNVYTGGLSRPQMSSAYRQWKTGR